MIKDGKLPKSGFVRIEKCDSDQDYYAVAVYERILLDKEIKKHELIDLNEPVKKLTRLRLGHEMRQSELSELTGISVRTIQSWELNGMGGASLSNAYKIAYVLNCSLVDLLEDEDTDWSPQG